MLVPMDGFHLANVALAGLGRADRKGAIDTFDGAGYAALLTRLGAAAGPTRCVLRPSRSIEESVANAIAVPAGTDVVITEGNYLLVDDATVVGRARAARRGVGRRVDPALRLERLVARHIEFGKPPDVAAAWVETVDVPNADFVRATFGRAHLIIRCPELPRGRPRHRAARPATYDAGRVAGVVRVARGQRCRRGEP